MRKQSTYLEVDDCLAIGISKDQCWKLSKVDEAEREIIIKEEYTNLPSRRAGEAKVGVVG